MTEAAECCVLDGNGVCVERIDFHDPAKTVWLVRLLVDIEAVVKFPPGLPQPGHAVARVARRLIATEILAWLVFAVATVGPEIGVKVFLSRQVRPPRRHAAGTVIERADRLLARCIVLGLQPNIAGSRAVVGHGRERADAAIIRAFEDDLPILAITHDLDYRDA